MSLHLEPNDVHVAPKHSALILAFIVKCTALSLLLRLLNYIKKLSSFSLLSYNCKAV